MACHVSMDEDMPLSEEDAKTRTAEKRHHVIRLACQHLIEIRSSPLPFDLRRIKSSPTAQEPVPTLMKMDSIYRDNCKSFVTSELLQRVIAKRLNCDIDAIYENADVGALESRDLRQLNSDERGAVLHALDMNFVTLRFISEQLLRQVCALSLVSSMP